MPSVVAGQPLFVDGFNLRISQAFVGPSRKRRRAAELLRLRSTAQLGKARVGEPVKSKKPRSMVHRQRLRLRFGRARLTLESKTTVPLGTSGDQSADLARIFGTHGHAWGPLLLQMGYKGFGRALSQMNSRGFVQAVSPWARQRIAGLRVGHRALVAAGIAIEAWQMARAIQRSIAQRSARPATAQAARSLTTWGAVWAGVELFGTGGALLGIELGPAVVVTTAIGATIGGCVGFFAGDWVARQIEEAKLDSAEAAMRDGR